MNITTTRDNLGPHNIDLSTPRGVTRTRSLGHAAKVNAQLQAYVRSEADKQRRNAERAKREIGQ